MILILYILFMNIYPAIWKIYIHKDDSITYLEICKEIEIITCIWIMMHLFLNIKIYLEEIILKFNANIIKIILNNNNYKNII